MNKYNQGRIQQPWTGMGIFLFFIFFLGGGRKYNYAERQIFLLSPADLQKKPKVVKESSALLILSLLIPFSLFVSFFSSPPP